MRNLTAIIGSTSRAADQRGLGVNRLLEQLPGGGAARHTEGLECRYLERRLAGITGGFQQ